LGWRFFVLKIMFINTFWIFYTSHSSRWNQIGKSPWIFIMRIALILNTHHFAIGILKIVNRFFVILPMTFITYFSLDLLLYSFIIFNHNHRYLFFDLICFFCYKIILNCRSGKFLAESFMWLLFYGYKLCFFVLTWHIKGNIKSNMKIWKHITSTN